MKSKIAIIALMIGCIGLSGCSIRMLDLTVGSSKNFDINSGDLQKGKRVVGEDSAPVFLFIPFGVPNMKEAVDNAIEQERCAVGLSDVVVTQNNHTLMMLVGTLGYEVEGNLIIDANKPGCENKVLND